MPKEQSTTLEDKLNIERRIPERIIYEVRIEMPRRMSEWGSNRAMQPHRV